MEILEIPIVDFYKHCLNSAHSRGFNWVVCLLARDADIDDLYSNLRKTWISLNSITGNQFLFVFAGNQHHNEFIQNNSIVDFHTGWRCVASKSASLINPHNDLYDTLSSIIPADQNYIAKYYSPYDWRNDRKNYLSSISDTHTDAISSLKEYFGLSEADIPCLVFTCIQTKHQYSIPLVNNNLYTFFKSLVTKIEPQLRELQSIENRRTDFKKRRYYLKEQLSQCNQQRISLEEKLFSLYHELVDYAASSGDESIRLCVENRTYKTISQPYRGKLSKYVDLAKEYERQKQIPFSLENITTVVSQLTADKNKITHELEEITRELPQLEATQKQLINAINTTIATAHVTNNALNRAQGVNTFKSRQYYLYQISQYLSYMESCVKIHNRNNLTDINIHLEQTLCGLLNRIFGWNLQNLNCEHLNSPGIDLADTTQKIAVQISSDASPKKIRSTINTFLKRGLNRTYRQLYIVFLRQHTFRSVDFSSNESDPPFVFTTTKNAWDTKKLYTQISSTEDVAKLHEIATYLESELGCFPQA